MPYQSILPPSTYFAPPTPDPIPYEQLPAIIRDAIWAVSNKTKAPLPLVTAAALAPVGFVCQSAINVSPEAGRVSPVTCNFLTVAESGERKTTVDNYFMASIYDYERQAAEKHRVAEQQYVRESESWKVESKALKSLLSKLTKKSQSTEEVKVRLMAHLQNEPSPPMKLQMLASDITPAALQYQLHRGGGSLLLHSAEGDIILSGQAIQNLGMQNDAWDGKPISVIRRHSESYTIYDARLSVSIMVQPAPWQKYLKNHLEQARGSGFLARFFLAQPSSTIGFRVGHTMENHHPWIEPYTQRLQQLLMRYVDKLHNCDNSRKTLTFSPEAQRYWGNLCELIERRMAPGGIYFPIRDFASKEGNKIARLAALFHDFSGEDGDVISVQTVESANLVCNWYLNEALRLFTPPPVIPQFILDADQLWLRLQEQFQDNNGQRLSKTWLRQRCPNKLRQPGLFDMALNHLCVTNRVTVFREGNTTYVAPWVPIYSPQQG
ncbi:DUF3987 domain-containing protein [Serratia fonticola]|uniref:YfjI family protein n=1 Tax=Serratia fonticola TaxID=47917 RepID=UPI001575C8A2|nr:YfjI family protein [Serratia fonticola]NTY86491.1 DUF3987 domain-containing protein [Serratia fonticola]NTZ12376.1 DUF3987 domain-containing protein [Serratia fonticola]